MVKPEILKGTRDFLPEEMTKRQYVADLLRKTFEQFGYDPIETPAIEYSKTILGKYGEEGNKLTYRFEDNGGRDICLRYDQTVPTARLVATYNQELPMPFKRYQIGRVWRADKPAKGRFREFYQFDIDIIGTDSLLADAEVAAVMNRVYLNLGFTKPGQFRIRFNSRRLINSILESLKIESDQFNSIIRIIDKIDKIGPEAVQKEISQIISPESAQSLVKIISLTGSNQQKLDALAALPASIDTSEISEFLQLCAGFNIAESNLVFDPSIARGLDYYTGIIYEVEIPEAPIGSVCAGGRYDNLCEMFTKQKFSGVGVAFGFDRTIVAMEELNLLPENKTNAQVLVTVFDEDSIASSQSIFLALQESGIHAELYPQSAKLAKQFKYADKKGVPYVITCGPDEQAQQQVTLKHLETGDQSTASLQEIISKIQ